MTFTQYLEEHSKKEWDMLSYGRLRGMLNRLREVNADAGSGDLPTEKPQTSLSVMGSYEAGGAIPGEQLVSQPDFFACVDADIEKVALSSSSMVAALRARLTGLESRGRAFQAHDCLLHKLETSLAVADVKRRRSADFDELRRAREAAGTPAEDTPAASLKRNAAVDSGLAAVTDSVARLPSLPSGTATPRAAAQAFSMFGGGAGAETPRAGPAKETLRGLERAVAGVRAVVEDLRGLLWEEARSIGDAFLGSEKYVNLNYLAVYNILKKHDALLPGTPCLSYYMSRLHAQKWIKADYSDLFVKLSDVYTMLRGPAAATPEGVKQKEEETGFVRSTRKYWVRRSDISTVKYVILQHLPVWQFARDAGAEAGGDSQLTTSVYLDNTSLELYHGRLDKKPGAIAARLRWYGAGDPAKVFVERKTHRESWKGEVSVKERFILPEKDVVPFLNLKLRPDTEAARLRAKGVSESDVAYMLNLFEELQDQVESKQLAPLLRTQYMRTAFQVPFDPRVRISLDTNLAMILENEYGQQERVGTITRWRRDPAQVLLPNEVTRFPHAVLEVKLSLPDGEEAPHWVEELINSGMLCQVHKFSKFMHGCAVLLPELTQAVPYWVDDASIRTSIQRSRAPLVAGEARASPPVRPPPSRPPDHEIAPAGAGSMYAPASGAPGTQPMGAHGQLASHHELLGAAPSLDLMGETLGTGVYIRPAAAFSDDNTDWEVLGCLPWWLGGRLGQPKPTKVFLKIEPKLFFSNERTYLSWLHMAVTLGGIGAALVGMAINAGGGSGKVAPMHGDGGGPVKTAQLVGLFLLPVAFACAMYAMWTFYWRAALMRRREPGPYDDPVGPVIVSSLLVTGLTATFVVCLRDIMDVAAAEGAGGFAPPPRLLL